MTPMPAMPTLRQQALALLLTTDTDAKARGTQALDLSQAVGADEVLAAP